MPAERPHHVGEGPTNLDSRKEKVTMTPKRPQIRSEDRREAGRAASAIRFRSPSSRNGPGRGLPDGTTAGSGLKASLS